MLKKKLQLIIELLSHKKSNYSFEKRVCIALFSLEKRDISYKSLILNKMRTSPAVVAGHRELEQIFETSVDSCLFTFFHHGGTERE